MNNRIVVDIDQYPLQRGCAHDPGRFRAAVIERLRIAGIPAEANAQKGITVTRGTLTETYGPVFLSYEWVPDPLQLDLVDFINRGGSP